jgi:hypothetical protein
MNYEPSFHSLLNFCQKNLWQGYDPYDGLNGKCNDLPLIQKSKMLKLALIHFNKSSHLNLRSLQFIPPNHNSKGIALFLSGALDLYQKTGSSGYLNLVHHFIEILRKNTLSGYSGPCWGYYFPWQSRAFYVPANTPSVVVTSFVGQALLDAYEILGDESLLNWVHEIQAFILHDLNRSYAGENFCLSYTPVDNSQIYNASILGAALLARLYRYNQDHNLKRVVMQLYAYCAGKQNDDGSWFYGEAANQKWIDHYHTSFVLEALIDIHQEIPELKIAGTLRKGIDFYLNNFFENGVIPKFHHNRLYPIEPHCGASAIILLSKLSEIYGRKYFVKAGRVADWFIHNMMDPEGYFYFQKNRFLMNKIPYMRWVQAWMFKALAQLIAVDALKNKADKTLLEAV